MRGPKKIATVYLSSGKELKFAFNELDSNKDGTNFKLNGNPIGFIPYNVPIIFEDYTNLYERLEELWHEKSNKKTQ